MDIKLLNQVEKQSIGERQPLPENYLRLSDDEMDARIAAAKQHARRAPGDPRSSLSARRGHQVRRLHRRLVEARARRGEQGQGRVHRVLRRALHGGERRHPLRAASESDSARPRRGLLDGRHGRRRSAGHVLARVEGDGCRRRCRRAAPASSPSPTSTRRPTSKRSAASTAASSAPRPTPRRSWRGRGSAARSWSCCPTSTSAATPRSRWASRSTGWSSGIRTKCGEASSPSR